MRVLSCLGLLLALAAAPALAQPPGPVPGKTYRVGFSQIIDHPALNATRAGFLEGLAAAGFVEGKNLTFQHLNAQGDVAKARAIADRFAAEKLDLIAPCTTPNVQAAMEATKGTRIPVAFGCVTSPVESGLLATLDKPTGTNVTGVYGAPQVARMFELILRLKPNTKIIAIIYNPAEPNSIAVNELSKAESVRRGLTWGEVQVSSSADVLPAVQALIGRVDTLLMPQDSTIASAFDAVVRVARGAKLPLYTYDPQGVERGAIASFAQNQHQAGIDWAREVAVPILLGKPPGEILPVPYRAYDLILNSAGADAAGIALPPELLKSAIRVFKN
jgi:putative ABC transport system substrate-binding protein